MIQILEQGPRNATVLVTDAGTIAMADLGGAEGLGAHPRYVSIMGVQYDAVAATIGVAFDATTDVVVLTLDDAQDFCFKQFGGIPDPKAAGYTGSVNITGTGPFTLILKLKKHY